jgi:heat shock protein HslJ
MKPGLSTLFAIAAAVCLIATSACSPATSPAQRSATTTAQGAPELQEIQGMTISGFELAGTAVTLSNGEWVSPPDEAGDSSRTRVSLSKKMRLIQDLNGDGQEEAAVLFTESGGGSGTYTYLAIIGRKQGKPVCLGLQMLGDRIQMKSAYIQPTGVVMELIQQGTGDAACCPGEIVTSTFRLAGNKIESVPAASKPERLTLDSIAKKEWVLRNWKSTEPAGDEPRITFTVKDGKVTGSAGCNSYFAGAQPGAAAGAVSIGPVGATRKACPGPEQAAQDRFLKQLGAVMSFGYQTAQLALNYRVGDSAEVMLFSPAME